ncbi:cell envelope integrity TolA C-terminal domain-containing protein [Aliivibrio fischeri]|uniref:cell envelope integrity TolA C-terminal domain-containing protein n=1 Tax=Aliivibrio fischeri TaxID=668 RepID=UPI0018C8023D|nr:cell envelope integrity TolA C-terminal domain-containing protein [Aliivibrio fischeri]
MKLISLLVFFLSLIINSAIAKEEGRQDNILNQSFTHESDEISKYAEIYIEKIQDSMLKKKNYNGSECRLRISLSPQGLVTNVDMNIQNRLCRDAFNVVWGIAEFPLPLNKEIASKLTTINVTLSY